MKFRILVMVILLASFTFYGCASNNNGTDSIEAELVEQKALVNQLTTEKEQLEDKVTTLESLIAGLEAEIKVLSEPDPDTSLLMTGMEVVELLQAEDMETLAGYVHPEQGLRFSPYTYVQPGDDLVFTPQEIANLMNDDQLYTWGLFDGKGNPIEFTFTEYYKRFIYDKDFANPHKIGNNQAIGSGNTINNIEEAYPEGKFIEFYFPGLHPDYGGMDWRSLRLVFEQFDDAWHLVGVVHDEWTI